MFYMVFALINACCLAALSSLFVWLWCDSVNTFPACIQLVCFVHTDWFTQCQSNVTAEGKNHIFQLTFIAYKLTGNQFLAWIRHKGSLFDDSWPWHLCMLVPSWSMAITCHQDTSGVIKKYEDIVHDPRSHFWSLKHKPPLKWWW